jgi:hypothetical protein
MQTATIPTSAATSEQAHEQQPVVNLEALKHAFEVWLPMAFANRLNYDKIFVYRSKYYPGNYYLSAVYDIEMIAQYNLMQWEYPARMDGEVDLPQCYRPFEEPGTWELIGSDFPGFPREIWHCDQCRKVTLSATGEEFELACSNKHCGVALLEEF